MCFPGREGENIFVFFSRIDMCFPGGGTHITWVMCIPDRLLKCLIALSTG